MGDINYGKVALRDRGNWNNLYDDYRYLDFVQYQGASYFVKIHTGVVPVGTLPTNTTYFGVLSSKGDQGTQGIQGVPGVGVGSAMTEWVAGAYATGNQAKKDGILWEAAGPTTSTDVPGVSNLWRYVLDGYKKDPFNTVTNLLTKAEARFDSGTTGAIGGTNWVTASGSLTPTIVGGALRLQFTSGIQAINITRAYLIAPDTDYYICLKARLVSGTSGDVLIGGFSSSKANGNVIIRPTSEWKIFTGKIRKITQDRMGIGMLAADNTGALMEFDDVILSTSPIPYELTGATKPDVWSAQAFNQGDYVYSLGIQWQASANTTPTDVPGTSPLWVEVLTGYKKDPFNDAVNLLTTAEARFNNGTAGSIGTPNWTVTDSNPVISIVNNTLRLVFTTPSVISSIKIARARLITAGVDYYIYLKARLVSGTTSDVQIGGFSSLKNSGNMVIRPTSEWKTYTGKINSSILNFMSIGVLAADNTGATYEFDDILLSTSPLLQELVPANTDGVTQEGRNIKILTCIVRPTVPLGATGGEEITWEILTTGQHKSAVATVADSSAKGYNLFIRYPACKNVMNFHVTTDETFAAYGLIAGASVAVDNANIQCYKRSNVGFLVSWDEANNRLGSGFGTVTGDNCIQVITSNIAVGGHYAESLQPSNDSAVIRLEYAGTNAYLCRPYGLSPVAGAKKFKVFNMVTGAEVVLSTLLGANDKFYLSGGISSQAIPLSVVSTDADIRAMQVTMFAPGCNFWISGVFEY